MYPIYNGGLHLGGLIYDLPGTDHITKYISYLVAFPLRQKLQSSQVSHRFRRTSSRQILTFTRWAKSLEFRSRSSICRYNRCSNRSVSPFLNLSFLLTTMAENDCTNAIPSAGAPMLSQRTRPIQRKYFGIIDLLSCEHSC